MDYKWLADGVTWDEVDLIGRLLQPLVQVDPEAARQITLGTLGPYLLGIVSESEEQAADYQWLADGLTVRELRAIIGIALIAKQVQEFPERPLGYSWLADGVSQRESNGIVSLASIAVRDRELARQIVSMGILDDPLRDRDLHAISTLNRLSEEDDTAPLTSQPWFTDGLNNEETAFLSVTRKYGQPDAMYRDFLRTHFTRSATISLPLAGNVDVWVFWHKPFPDSDDTIELIEEAARASEALIGTSFPTTDIIVLLGDPGSLVSVGYYAGTHIQIERDGANDKHVIHHETTHYYNLGVGHWFNEGFAEFVASYCRPSAIMGHVRGVENPRV